MGKIQSIRGMNDLLPDEAVIWQHIEKKVFEIVSKYGYREIRFPILEDTGLFKRAIGEVTDIVEKEMYTFIDRNGDSLTLRPEGTAGCVRACDQNGLLYNQTQKLWYAGPMFRHERPQKGRLRQFHQIGVEAFGFEGPDIDAEMLLLTSRIWLELGIKDELSLELNSIGSAEARAKFKMALVDYLSNYINELDEDSKRRLNSNPLRILDSKILNTQKILESAPSLADFLDNDSKLHFDHLCDILDRCGINYKKNTGLVRGLDYYNKTVFEWVTNSLGAQGTICAGGRYDGLVGQLGGKNSPAVGLAMGMERLALLVSMKRDYRISDPDIYIIYSEGSATYAFHISEDIRNIFPEKKIIMNFGGGNFKSQFKRADKSGAEIALIVGENELSTNTVTIKQLRCDAEQITVSAADLHAILNNMICL